MRKLRPFLTPTILLVLLLSSMAGTATHEHSVIDPASRDCAVRHGDSSVDDLEIRRTHDHRHECHGFHLNGQRITFGVADCVSFAVTPRCEPSFNNTADSFRFETAGSTLPRGPPLL